MRLQDLFEDVRKDKYTAHLERLIYDYFRAGKNCHAYKAHYLLMQYRSPKYKNRTMVKDKKTDKWYPVNRQKWEERQRNKDKQANATYNNVKRLRREKHQHI